MNRAMKIGIVLLGLTLCSFLAFCTQQADQAGNSGAAASTMTQEQMVARGKYLTTIAGCNDCHTPKVMGPHGPEFDTTRTLSGHPESDPIPEFPATCLSPTGWMASTNFHLSAWAGPWGISFAANLTPDQTTGSGAWTEDSFIEAHADGQTSWHGERNSPAYAVADYRTDDRRRSKISLRLPSVAPADHESGSPADSAAGCSDE